MRLIRDGSTKRVLSMLEDLAKHDRHDAAADAAADGVTDVVSEEDKAKEGKYSQFYAEFGPCSRKAWARTLPTRNASPSCLRFSSTSQDEAIVSLADYKAPHEGRQDAIYYITADSLTAARNSPQLEVFRKKGIEVRLMAGPRGRMGHGAT